MAIYCIQYGQKSILTMQAILYTIYIIHCHGMAMAVTVAIATRVQKIKYKLCSIENEVAMPIAITIAIAIAIAVELTQQRIYNVSIEYEVAIAIQFRIQNPKCKVQSMRQPLPCTNLNSCPTFFFKEITLLVLQLFQDPSKSVKMHGGAAGAADNPQTI